jgi:hypothetical protein
MNKYIEPKKHKTKTNPRKRKRKEKEKKKRNWLAMGSHLYVVSAINCNPLLTREIAG